MNLHEYQSKRLFADYGIPVPRGIPADSPNAAVKAAQEQVRVAVAIDVRDGPLESYRPDTPRRQPDRVLRTPCPGGGAFA